MKIRQATINDIELLIKLRIDFFDLIGTKLSQEQNRTIRKELEGYLQRHFAAGDFIAFLAEDAPLVAAAAFMVINEKPPGPSFLSGVTGTLMNVMTYPRYRKNGYATLLIKAMIDKAGELNVPVIDLYATQAGEKLYRDLGFVTVKDTAMQLKL